MVLSYKTSNLTSISTELERGTALMASRVNQVAEEMSQKISDEYSKNPGTQQRRISREFLAEVKQLPYTILIYRDDSLDFWSDNTVIPTLLPSSFSDSVGFQKLKNGYYLTYKKSTVNKSGKVLSFIALAPVKYDYITSNIYLRNHFSKLFDLPSYFDLSIDPRPGYLPVTIAPNKTLFYLGISETLRDEKPGLISPILFMAALLALMLFFNSIIAVLSSKRSWLRPIFWAVVFGGIVFFINRLYLLPDDLENWSMFNPVLFASSAVATSLGGLFIEFLVLLWISIDLTYNFTLRIRIDANSIWNYITHLVGYFVIFIMVIYSVVVIQALVRDSKIEFAFINPLHPDYFSILGVLNMALLLLCLYLFSEKIISILFRNPLPIWDRILLLLICTTSALTYYFLYNIGISGMWVMLWTFVFILLLSAFRIAARRTFTFSRLFLWLVFFSASGAILLFYYGEQKEKVTRLVYAKKLISDRDAVTEFLLDELHSKIEHDPFIIQYFQSPQLATKQLSDRLQQLYFQEGFSRYTLRFYPFDSSGILLPGWGEDFGFVTENGLKNDKTPVGNENLFYSLSTTGNITYLSQFNISRGDTMLGRLYVELKADVYKSASVYPELLLPEKDRLPASTPDYSYAIYNRGKLIDHHGAYNYDFRMPWSLEPNMEVQYRDDSFGSHLIYSPRTNIAIIVSKANDSFTYFLSFFSFLFLVMFILGLLLLFFSAFRVYPGIPSLGEYFKEAPLRSLIHAFFLIFTISMLLAIGYVTGQYFLKQFNQLAKTTVHDKLERVTEAIQDQLNENKITSSEDTSLRPIIRSNITEYAEVQDNEVNCYDRNGDLIASSQPSIFEKGIISKKINPQIYYELKRETKMELITDEQIGSLQFYSGYAAIRNSNGQLIMFVNLPYYNSSKNLDDQVGFFFIALVNILVFATIIAGFMAPLISRQITLRLALIGEKFRKVNVGAANETIDWPVKDEIGSLVEEYNKMIKQLEESANKLARSQREMAWREMARQVAHEIKNPLTPMKLSIQHLQRAYRNNVPNLKELTESVTRTLIEQIDTLSEIATEFSNFAKMPRPEIEQVDVNQILRSACDLHGDDRASIHLHDHAEQSIVEADKRQLIRVFNNLILNAIQAIPENEAGEINVITENYDGQIVVSVHDNGVGISEDESQRVFIPNFTTKSSGTGLGLAMSKNIIESFGGNISFTSQKNAGTTFYVRLPLANSYFQP